MPTIDDRDGRAQGGPDGRGDRFDRFATAIGDLDSPFYREERDRDVWNEASAVGFQFLLWGILLAATTAIWVVGEPAQPYVLAGSLLVGGASVLVASYAHRRGVDGGAAEVLAASRGRVVTYGVLVVALAVGVVTDGARSSGLAELDVATVAGMVVGAGVTLGAAAAATRFARRRAPLGEDVD
jgi:hypothetical protein